MTLWEKILNFFGFGKKESDIKSDFEFKINGVKQEKPKDTVTVSRKAYENLTKNKLVGMLWDRGISHNKRMLKEELIDLLVEDDKKKFK